MTRQNPEERLQFVVVKYLRMVLLPGAVFWHVPNGGKMTEARRMKQAGLGELPGVSDIMILWNGALHCMELKVRKDPIWGIKKTTYQSDDQKAFQAAIVAAGGFYAVVRHTDEVRELLAHWGIPTRESRCTARSKAVGGTA